MKREGARSDHLKRLERSGANPLEHASARASSKRAQFYDERPENLGPPIAQKFNYRGLVIEAPFANGAPVLRQESKGVNMETATQVMDNQFIPCQPEVTINPDHAAKAEEEIIASDIASTWRKYRQLQGSVKKSQNKLQSLGQSLGEALFGMKAMLAKPGRNGSWSQFLRKNKIPRTSGDRLVRAYERSINSGVNCTVGAIQPLTQDSVHKLCAAIWARSHKKLTSYELTYMFLCEMAVVSGTRHEVREGGVFLFDSPLETAPESSRPAAPLPTSEGHAAVDTQACDAVE